MNPYRSFIGETGKKSNPIEQPFPEMLLEDASQKKAGREEDEEKGPDEIVKLVDHRTTEVVSGMNNKSEIRISKSETNPNIKIPDGYREGHFAAFISILSYFGHSCLIRISCFGFQYYVWSKYRSALSVSSLRRFSRRSLLSSRWDRSPFGSTWTGSPQRKTPFEKG